MNNLIKKHESVTPQLEYGRVILADDGVVVETSLGELEAQKAVSCLVSPKQAIVCSSLWTQRAGSGFCPCLLVLLIRRHQ